MAKIPDISPNFSDLGTPPVPVSDRPISSVDLTAPGKALQNAGAEGEAAANNIMELQGRTDIAFAKSNYITSMINTQKEEENNPDWQGAPKRWQDTSKKALEDATAQIGNLRYKAEFQAEATDLTWRQYSSFLQNNDVKRRQDGMAKTMQSNQNDMTSALAASDDETASTIINNVNTKLKSAAANGFITPAQEIEERNKWVQDYGKAKVQQFQEAGDPEGARDWFNRHINLLNPTPAAVNQINAAVTLPRADGTTSRIMAGAPIADSQKLGDAQQQIESNNNQSAVSTKGAIGVMQLLPSTAMEVATRMGVPYDPERLKNDPIYNRQLGDEYRNEMISRYHGNQTLALAAYNAGPGNVDKWIKQFGNPNVGEISDADFISKIPFKETQNYVTAINAKAPPTPGVPFDGIDPVKSHEAWLTTANTLPPAIRDLASTSIQARFNNDRQAVIDGQTSAAKSMIMPIIAGQINDPSHLQTPEMQQAWSNASPELQKAVLGGLKSQQKDSQEYGPKFWDLYKGVHAPDGDPGKITDPTQFYKYGDGNGLTLKGIQQLTQEIDGKKTADGAAKGAMQAQTFKVIKSQVSGEDLFPGMKDPKGEEIFAQAMPLVYKAIAEGEAKGIPSSELYNPKSPSWVGNVAKGLIRTPDQWHSDIVGANMMDDNQVADKSGGLLSAISKYINPFDSTIKNEANTKALEADFKTGKYSTPDTKPQGLAVLKSAAANGSITKEKFKELAVANGYAAGGK